MILKLKDKIGSGAYSEVFHDLGQGLAFKLFINGKHPTNISQGLTRPQDDKRRQRVFASECNAYHIAMDDCNLQLHVARFSGTRFIDDVIASNGSSVRSQYCLECCYAMEYLPGSDAKLRCAQEPHVLAFLSLMRTAGIAYLEDCSVFDATDPDAFKIIDFATEEPDWGEVPYI